MEERDTRGQVGTASPDIVDADVHLQRLLVKETDKPWLVTFFNDLKEYIHPPKLPPLDVTSKPVMVKDVWGFSGGKGKQAGLSSVLIHGGVIALAFLVGTNQDVQDAVKKSMFDEPIDIAPYVPQAAPKKQQMGGGGGGGDRSPLPASKGKLPKP